MKQLALHSFFFFLCSTHFSRREPNDASVGLRSLCLSCPGMFAAVAVHQASFICLHVKRAASGRENLQACVDCQAIRASRGLCQDRSSVDVDNCRCDNRGRQSSPVHLTLTLTQSWFWHQGEQAGRCEDNVSASVITLSLCQWGWTSWQRKIQLLERSASPRCLRGVVRSLHRAWSRRPGEADQAGNISFERQWRLQNSKSFSENTCQMYHKFGQAKQ